VAKSQPVDVVPKLVKLLQSLGDSVGRRRAIQAALMVMGEASIDMAGGDAGDPSSGGGGAGGAGAAHRSGRNMTVPAYFQAKAPKGKIEELAVAARYREEYGSAAPGTPRE
jgi:hypothetical protein